MKKIHFTSLLLAAVMLLSALSFTGCDNSSGPDTSDVSTSAAVPEETDLPGETTSEETTSEDTTVPETQPVLKTPEEQFRYGCYANGRLTDKLLDSVNPGVLSLLSSCMYYEDQLQEGIKKGQKWVYSNSSTYVPQSGSFDSMLKSGKYGANCAMPQAWHFIDMGIVTNGKHIYGNESGDMANFSSLGKYIGAVCTITSWEGSVKFSEIYAKKEVLPGDIFLAKGHTFIYLGDNLFMAAGHDGHWHKDESAKTEDSRKAVFDSWLYKMTGCSNYTCTVYWQIRFRDEYVPRFYRNSDGELVANPAYDPSKNTEYKQGVSKETPDVIYKVEKHDVYDDSGRTNVILNIAPSTSNGFNMSKLTSADNMTDGRLYYDNKANSYTDCVILGGNSFALNPTYYCDANGDTNPVKDDTHKYIAGIKFNLKNTATVDSFALYTQAVGASSNKPFGDIDGFDVLVSADGRNWTVAYSVENATSGDKWSLPDDPANKASTGYYMCHYIRADFDKAYEANYVLLAITSPRTQTPGKSQGTDYSIADTSAHYFRISEFQVYEKQK